MAEYRPLMMKLSRGRSPTMVSLRPEEYELFAQAAGSAELPVSTWLRRVALAAAGASDLKGDLSGTEMFDALTEAAEESLLPLSSWLRLVGLSAVGESALSTQLGRARSAHRRLSS